MNRQTAKAFREDLNKALASLKTKYEAEIKVGAITFGNSNLKVKLDLTEKPKDGKSIEQVEFEKNCWKFGLKAEDYGKSFYSQGEMYSLTALKPRSPRFPVVGKSPFTGKSYKFTHLVLKDILSEGIING